MNAKMACQSVARRIHQVVGITGRSHLHKTTLTPCWRTSSRGTHLVLYPRRWASTKQGSKQEAAGLLFTKRVVRSRPSTLDPTKFTQNDVVDLSGTGRCMMKVRDDQIYVSYKAFGGVTDTWTHYVPFPPGTKGVFYFHDRTNVHPVAGDVRFRILPLDKVQDWRLVDCKQLFAEGEDLLDHNGFGPWHISLLSIVYKQRPVLLELLKQCGYISQAVEMEVERLRLFVAARRKYVPGMNSQIIDKIVDPFIIDLGSSETSVVFLQQESITPHRFGINSMTYAVIPRWREKHIAYSGTVLVRFEMIRHEQQNRIALRVLKFLKPPIQTILSFRRRANFSGSTILATEQKNPGWPTPQNSLPRRP